MQNRKDAFLYPGGDTVAMLSLKKYLSRLGVEVDISLESEPSLGNYDWVLIFNILRTLESYAQFRNAKKQHKKIALMPIYWEREEFEKYGRNQCLRILNRIVGRGNTELFKNILRSIKNKSLLSALKYQFLKGYFRQQEEMIKTADIVLPNSYQEKDLLEKKFGSFRTAVIYNGIDLETFEEGDPERFKKKYHIDFEKFGLCVARFDEGKNQLAVIKALKGENIPVVFIGYCSPFHKKYFHLCQKNANKITMRFLSFLDQKELKDAYSAAHFHILASWFEVTGLVNLEAGLYNCNLVISDRGPVKEYFDDLVWYCSPHDLTSIKKAVLEAYNAKRGYYKLRERILNQFSWEKIALNLKNVLENFEK